MNEGAVNGSVNDKPDGRFDCLFWGKKVLETDGNAGITPATQMFDMLTKIFWEPERPECRLNHRILDSQCISKEDYSFIGPEFFPCAKLADFGKDSFVGKGN